MNELKQLEGKNLSYFSFKELLSKYNLKKLDKNIFYEIIDFFKAKNCNKFINPVDLIIEICYEKYEDSIKILKVKI